MIDRTALLADLRRRLRLLERDLGECAEEASAMAAALDAEYRAARAAERTGDTFRVWRSRELTQAAVAWLLGCVFVRFAEDNGLIEAPLIGGPGGRNARAVDRQTLYFRERPTDSDRNYLLDVFAEAARLPALAELYDRTRNPVWRYGISGDAARDLLAFWRAVDPGFRRAPPRLQRPRVGHPVPRRSVPGSLGRREETVRPAANAGVRRGVHPRPHANPRGR